LRYKFLLSRIALNDTFQAVSNLDLRAFMLINTLAIVANGRRYEPFLAAIRFLFL